MGGRGSGCGQIDLKIVFLGRVIHEVQINALELAGALCELFSGPNGEVCCAREMHCLLFSHWLPKEL
jgi:hypothetical protein